MKKLIFILLASISIAHAQEYKTSAGMSKAEILQVISNQQNQKNVELIMFALKSIEELNITEMNKKIEFVDTLQVSDEIKTGVKSQIKQNLSYSDHERVGYGIYQLKKDCSHHSISKLDTSQSYYDYIYNMNTGRCVFQLRYSC